MVAGFTVLAMSIISLVVFYVWKKQRAKKIDIYINTIFSGTDVEHDYKDFLRWLFDAYFRHDGGFKAGQLLNGLADGRQKYLEDLINRMQKLSDISLLTQLLIEIQDAMASASTRKGCFNKEKPFNNHELKILVVSTLLKNLFPIMQKIRFGHNLIDSEIDVVKKLSAEIIREDFYNFIPITAEVNWLNLKTSLKIWDELEGIAEELDSNYEHYQFSDDKSDLEKN